jgi:hypothetical protein
VNATAENVRDRANIDSSGRDSSVMGHDGQWGRGQSGEAHPLESVPEVRFVVATSGPPVFRVCLS